MKIYYSTDGTLDDMLEQVCPFGEKHNYTIGKKNFSDPRYVGSGGCQQCPFCYGAGFDYAPYGIHKPNKIALFPVLTDHGCDDWGSRRTKEEKQLELGIKQFAALPDSQYVKCAKMYVNVSKRMKFKIWMWHHITKKLQDLAYNILDRCKNFHFDLKYPQYKGY